jgi:hypothetical protein
LPEQIANLIEYIKGAAIPTAKKTSLIDYLQTVLANPRRSTLTCRAMDLLVAVVKLSSVSAIPADKGLQIVADATRIKVVIGCL